MANFEIQGPDGKKYRVQGETAEGALAALKKMLGGAAQPPSQGSLDMTAKSEAAIKQAELAGPTPGLTAFMQGGLQGYGDEIAGGIASVLTGEPYEQVRNKFRATIEAAEAEAPTGAKFAGNLATGIPAALLTGGASLPAVLGAGALLGGVSAYGETQENDIQAIKDVALGGALGAGGGALGFGAGKLLEKFTTKGLSAGAIQKALDGKIGELLMRVRQLGGSAAEADDVLREVLRGQAAKNPTAAIAAVPGARQRLSDVNANVIDEINRIVSPENVAGFTKRTQASTRAVTKPGYQAVSDDAAQMALTPEISTMPGVDDALDAAKEMAAFEKRAFDPNALTVQDLDVMQRFLRLSKEKSFQGTALETMKGPAYGAAREEVNTLAKQASPALAQSQAAVALQKSVEEATDLGKAALNPSKEAVEIAEEFAALGPEAQAGYRAAFATRLRAQIAMRGTGANAANILDKPAVIDKLKALGFPAEDIDKLVKGGAAARGVVDALQGGSDTARKLAAAKASESPMTQLKPTDLITGALVHPATVGLLPMLRSAGSAQERRVAEMVIRALTDQDPAILEIFDENRAAAIDAEYWSDGRRDGRSIRRIDAALIENCNGNESQDDQPDGTHESKHLPSSADARPKSQGPRQHEE